MPNDYRAPGLRDEGIKNLSFFLLAGRRTSPKPLLGLSKLKRHSVLFYFLIDLCRPASYITACEQHIQIV
jgi:hypothetical protein